MQIFVKHPDGVKTITLKVKDNYSIDTVKTLVKNNTSIPKTTTIELQGHATRGRHDTVSLRYR